MKKYFQRLFRNKKQKPSSEVPTLPLPRKQLGEKKRVGKTKLKFDVPQLVVGCSQSIGTQREHNEDALFTLTTMLANNGEYLPFGLFIVADGMGGHKQGEIASSIATRSIASQVVKKILLSLLAVQPTAPSESIQEILECSVQEAHQTIIKNAPESGSTLTIVLILDKQMSIAHVGDSRAYTISPNGDMEVLTRDHSLVMRMIELGQLTQEEASVHPQRNVLYRAMGYGEPITADISTFPLPDEGHILICSDGLWSVVPQEEMSRLITDSPDPTTACQWLINAANAAGGPDNISVILVNILEQAI